MAKPVVKNVNAPIAGTPPRRRTWAGDVGHAFAHGTLRSASPGSWYKPLTGTVPGTMVSTGLGLLGGRYILSPLLQRLFPDTFRNPHRSNVVSTIGGGLLGLSTMLPQIMQSKRNGGWFSSGPNPDRMMRKHSVWWSDTSVRRSMMNSVINGDLDPVSAQQVIAKNERSKVPGTRMTHSSTFARALTGAGLGYGAAQVATGLASVLFGTKFSPEERNRLSTTSSMMGGVANALGVFAGGK